MESVSQQEIVSNTKYKDKGKKCQADNKKSSDAGGPFRVCLYFSPRTAAIGSCSLSSSSCGFFFIHFGIFTVADLAKFPYWWQFLPSPVMFSSRALFATGGVSAVPRAPVRHFFGGTSRVAHSKAPVGRNSSACRITCNRKAEFPTPYTLRPPEPNSG